MERIDGGETEERVFGRGERMKGRRGDGMRERAKGYIYLRVGRSREPRYGLVQTVDWYTVKSGCDPPKNENRYYITCISPFLTCQKKMY